MSVEDGGAARVGSERGTGRDGRRNAHDGGRGAGDAGDPAAAASSDSVPDAALIAELPVESAVALRLHRAGHPDATIGVALGIPVQAVPVTLQIAHGKLDALARE